MKRAILISSVMLALPGCVTNQIHFADNPPTTADLVQQVKYEVSEFEDRLDTIPFSGRCAQDFDMEVTTVSISVTSAVTRKNSESASAEIPLGSGSIGPEFSLSSLYSGTQKTTFTLYPTDIPSQGPNPPGPSDKFADGTPIADALETVARALDEASDFTPCVTFGDPLKQKNTVSYGLKFERSRSAGGKVKIIVFSLGAESSSTETDENTIVVNFSLKGSSIMAAPLSRP